MSSSQSQAQTPVDDHNCRHMCLPFETDDEKREAVLVFVHAGLSRGARCIFVGTTAEYEELGVNLEESGICTKRAVSRGALLHFTTDSAYYEDDGQFDPTKALARWDKLLDEALSDGFTGIRTTAELSRVPADPEWRRILWYDAQVNDHFARRPLWNLCRYPRALIPPERVQDVLRTHPIAVVRGELCENPFYERAELALSDDVRARLDWQFRQLRVQQRARRRLEDKTASAVTAATELSIELEALRGRVR
jgi:hypothetical protein